MSELAAHFDVHANQIATWKARLLDGAAGVFGSGAASSVGSTMLHANIGQLALENDFFGRRARQGGILGARR